MKLVFSQHLRGRGLVMAGEELNSGSQKHCWKKEKKTTHTQSHLDLTDRLAQNITSQI